MIEINLLPQELKRKRKTASFKMPDIDRLTGLPQVLIVSGVVGFMIVAQLLVLGFLAIAGKQLNTAEKRLKEIQPQVTEVRDLKARIKAMDDKLAVLDAVVGRKIRWAKKLSELSDSLTPDVWLTHLVYDEQLIEKAPEPVSAPSALKGQEKKQKPPQKQVMVLRLLTVGGYAFSKTEGATTSVTTFIEGLKKNNAFAEDFSQIDLGGPIQEATVDEVEAMSFTIQCYFNDAR